MCCVRKSALILALGDRKLGNGYEQGRYLLTLITVQRGILELDKKF